MSLFINYLSIYSLEWKVPGIPLISLVKGMSDLSMNGHKGVHILVKNSNDLSSNDPIRGGDWVPV